MGINNFKYKTKEFIHKNKQKIRTGFKWTLGIAAVLGIGALIKDDRNKSKIIDEMGDVIDSKNQAIDNLTELCYEKDRYFDEVISDGLRHGSKLASKHMRDKKDYLNGK